MIAHVNYSPSACRRRGAGRVASAESSAKGPQHGINIGTQWY